jgi:hypothetical protein
MNTLSGFLDHVLARGLSESLPFFGLADQPLRALVFWTLLRLHIQPAHHFLAALGCSGWLRREWRLALLYGARLSGNYAFVISLRAQDIMAYLLGPFMVVGSSAGVGVLGLLHLLRRRAVPAGSGAPAWCYLSAGAGPADSAQPAGDLAARL